MNHLAPDTRSVVIERENASGDEAARGLKTVV